jgi:hypothetical protein
MSPKRFGVVLLVFVTAPVWLALRTRFGERFLLLLLVTWAIGFGFVWVLNQPGFTPPEPYTAALLPVALLLYEASIVLWAGQLLFGVAYRWGVMLGEYDPPHPNYVGAFWLTRNNHAIPDLLAGVCLVMLISGWIENLAPAARPIAVQVAATLVGLYWLLAYGCHVNGDILPIRAPRARPKPGGRFYLSRLRTVASRPRESLSAVFSRREPGLRELKHSIRKR